MLPTDAVEHRQVDATPPRNRLRPAQDVSFSSALRAAHHLQRWRNVRARNGLAGHPLRGTALRAER